MKQKKILQFTTINGERFTLKGPLLLSDPSELRCPPSFLGDSGVDPEPASPCPSLPLSDRLLCGVSLHDLSPNRPRPLEPEAPLTAPASLLKTGEDAAKLSRVAVDGRNQSAQDRQGVGGAFRRSSIPDSSTSSCSRVAFTLT